MIDYFKFRYSIFFIVLLIYASNAETEEVYNVNKFPTPIEGKARAKFVGARVKDPELASYVYRWQRRIEKIGNENIPAEALKNTMQGDVMLSIRILSDGSLVRIELDKSSGNKELDKHMSQIITNAAPFEPFTDAMKKDIDMLGITKTWSYIYNYKVGNWFFEEVQKNIKL